MTASASVVVRTAEENLPDPFVAEVHRQIVQNLIFFGGLVFSQQLFQPMEFATALVGYGTLTFLTIAIRAVTFDLAAGHTLSHSRLISQWFIGPVTWIAGSLFVFFLVGSTLFGWKYWFVLVLILLTGLLHDLFLRTLVLLDVFSIAVEFVLKAIAGAFILGVATTPWLVICAFLLALLVSVGQRRNEIEHLDEDRRRAILRSYSSRVLNQMMGVAASSVLIAYALYTIDASTVEHVGSTALVYTLPVVLYGIFRYVYLVLSQNISRGLEATILEDRALLASVGVWLVQVLFTVY